MRLLRAYLKIKGTYVNNRIGFQISLPECWSGEEIKFLVNMEMLSSEEFELSDERPDTFEHSLIVINLTLQQVLQMKRSREDQSKNSIRWI